QFIVLIGTTVEFRICRINTVHIVFAHQYYIRLHLRRTERRSGVSGEVRITDACCEDYDAALFKVSDCPSSDIGLRNLFHLNRGEHTCLTAKLLEAVLQCQGVHYSGKHPHVIPVPRSMPRSLPILPRHMLPPPTMT